MVESHITLLTALAALVLTALGEFLHLKRSKKLGPLAFGPDAKPRPWTTAAPVLRCISLTLLAWGFVVLLILPPHVEKERELKEDDFRHVVILLDVSPSMQIHDGGIPAHSNSATEQTRAQRGAETMLSILERLHQDEIRFTVVAFYTGARTIISDTKDPNIITNIMRDLPITNAFKGGKTDIFSGLQHTFDLAKEWNSDSTTVIMVTDGDSIPATGMPKMPDSIAKFLVVGVGDTTQGTQVHEHLSRQDSATLRQLASRLGGDYQDVNNQQLSTAFIENLTSSAKGPESTIRGFREYAKFAILIGGLILLALPVALEKLGCHWKSSRTLARKL